MNEESVKAWQPLTFGGVARYGHDWLGRLFFTCFVVSVITATVVIWTASRAWVPSIEEAITRLPPGAEIRSGRLNAPQALRLAENSYLSFRLDPAGNSAAASLGDIQIVLAPSEIRFRSLFGVSAIPYRPEWTLLLNPAELEPKWAAWKPAVMAYLFFGTIVGLFASWIGLATPYAFIALLFAAALGRSLTLWGGWKLSVAALLPGAVLLTVVLGLYGLGHVRLAELIVAWALHFAVGWIFLIGATFRLPRRRKAAINPFEGDAGAEDPEEKPTEKNPFKKMRGQRNRGGPPSS